MNLNDQFGFVPDSDIAPSDGGPQITAPPSSGAIAATGSPAAPAAGSSTTALANLNPPATAAAPADVSSLDFSVGYVAVVIGNNTYRNGISA